MRPVLVCRCCAAACAAVKFRGGGAQTNFSMTNYPAELEMQDRVRATLCGTLLVILLP